MHFGNGHFNFCMGTSIHDLPGLTEQVKSRVSLKQHPSLLQSVEPIPAQPHSSTGSVSHVGSTGSEINIDYSSTHYQTQV